MVTGSPSPSLFRLEEATLGLCGKDNQATRAVSAVLQNPEGNRSGWAHTGLLDRPKGQPRRGSPHSSRSVAGRVSEHCAAVEVRSPSTAEAQGSL